MQQPTCINTHVQTTHDAKVIFHAVAKGKLPMVIRRLDTDERRSIASGSVYVWEERTSYSDPTVSKSAIERWTDSVRWGPSRVRDEFLYYQEKQSSEMTTIDLSSTSAIIRYQPCYRREPLIKQTYSVFVSTPHGQKKWHLIAYYTQKTLDRLYRVRDNPFHPELATIRVPPNVYQSARSSRPGPSQRSLGTVAPASTSRSPSRESSETSSTKSSNSRGSVMNEGNVLPPLEALQDLVQPTRHPLDEKAIMSFPLYEFFIASP